MDEFWLRTYCAFYLGQQAWNLRVFSIFPFLDSSELLASLPIHLVDDALLLARLNIPLFNSG